MTLNENEAKKKRCANADYDRLKRCEASHCMAWVWIDPSEPDPKAPGLHVPPPEKRRGTCGLLAYRGHYL